MFSRFIYFSLFIVLLGCVPYEDPTECFPALRINFKSTSDVDSVHFYLNNELVCFEKPIDFEGRCKNCLEAKGFMTENVICATSAEDSNYIFMSRDAEKEKQCFQSENFLKWVDYECFVSEKHYRKSLDSLTFQAQIFSNESMKTIQPSIIFHSGNRYNIMLEQDSAQWLNHTHNVVDDVFFAYLDLAESWLWEGCSDGFCVATIPMREKEACYDK